MFVGIKINLGEREPRLLAETIRTALHELEQLRVIRRRLGGQILEQEFQLLPHALAQHRVILVESHRQRLAIVNLFADVALDQRSQFGIGGRAQARALEPGDQLFNLAGIYPNLIRRRKIRFLP